MQPPIFAAQLRRRHKTPATGRKSSSAQGIRQLRIPGGRGRYGGWDQVLIQCRLTSGIRQAAWIESFRERIGYAKGQKDRGRRIRGRQTCQRRFLRRYSARPLALSLVSSRNRAGSPVVKWKQDLPCMCLRSFGEIFFAREGSQ
jgi:hypothetical protein